MTTSRWELFRGDCLGYLASLPDASIDAMITDPPYCSGGYLEAQKNTKAQGLRGATVNAEGFQWFASDNMGTSGLVWLLRAVMVECRRVLRPNRSALIFTDWRMVPVLAPALESSGLRYRNMLIWDKGNAGLGVGFKPAYEVILEFCNGATDYHGQSGSNLLRAPRVHSSRKVHGAEKPVALLTRLVGVVTRPGDCILDPFAGSGTTGVAALESGRRFKGCEADPKYHAIALERLERAETVIPIPDAPPGVQAEMPGTADE